MLTALYLVAWKCRDPATRREAVSLLKKLKLQEGIFSSNILARFAEAMADIEETRARSILGLASDCPLSCELVPEGARLLEAGIAPDPYDNAYGRLIYAVWGEDGSGQWELREERVKIAMP